MNPQMSIEDKRTIDIWENSIKVIDGHYQLDIPFKNKDPCLPNNYSLAKVHLESLGRKLSKQPLLFEKYKREIHTLLDKGYAEPVDDKDILNAEGRTWYLPHHGVTSTKKPDKLRIVFDCAAKYTGVSLNEHVLQGPEMTSTLIGVLLRFRERPVAIMGDVEAMFHQVKVTPRDRDALRFLWWEDDDINKDPQVFRMTVHLFDGVWSPSCASFAMRRTADDNAKDFDLNVMQTVKENFYVDDCLKSVHTVKEAIEMVDKLTQLLQKGGFNITKWVSNNSEVIRSTPVEHRAKTFQEINVNPLPAETALGVYWKTESDDLGFKITTKARPNSRRGMMSIISSVYDPFGFISPFLLQAKKLLQQECKMGKDWDDPLTDDNQKKWRQWKEELPELEIFEVKRCIIPKDFGLIIDCQIHHFSDASLEGYGTVSYIRIINSDGRIHCAFLVGKSRLAPLKQLTIPRLELSAAVLAVKIDRMLCKELSIEINTSVFWTDSMVVLHYIKNTSKRFQIFVANRVAAIHDGSQPEQWKYVETKNNPADICSRGLHAKNLLQSKLWIEGPEFLWKENTNWPEQPSYKDDLLDGNNEVKTSAKVHTITKTRDVVHDLMLSFSSWNKLRRSVAWLLRFKKLLYQKSKDQGVKSMKWNQGSLKVNEIKIAEQEMLKLVQDRHFRKDLESISKGGCLKKSSPLFSLDPVVDDDGLLRIKGRLPRAPVDKDAKHQIIIPKGHHVGELLVRHYQVLLAHSGKEHVLSEIRRRYWLIRARPTVNKVLRNCMICIKQHAKGMLQRMSDLPTDRITPDKPPFTFVGIDCFGPFHVKRGRSMVKRYGCIFTCLTTRAIHLEVLHSMESDSFINAFTRFQCRRGKPELVRSDNGTNFIGAQREIQQAIRDWNHEKIEQHLQQSDIQWLFNPPAASHMGGVWERLIRSVRQVLEVLLKEQNVDDEGLSTIMCEAESIVNSRPLTSVSDDPKDLNPLTPNHLLLLRSSSTLPYGQFSKLDTYRKRWKQVQFLSDQFWKRWLREYLPTLQVRQKWINPKRNLQTGDIVLIMNENVPRREWPLARVIRTYPGDDGYVRSADVKSRWGELKRPIHKLCFLESVDT